MTREISNRNLNLNLKPESYHIGFSCQCTCHQHERGQLSEDERTQFTGGAHLLDTEARRTSDVYDTDDLGHAWHVNPESIIH